MATAKIDWIQNPGAHQNYLSQERDGETVENRSLAFEGDVISQFQSVHDLHGSKTKYLYFEITQSWDPRESKMFEPEKYNEMGIELATRLFPGHQVQVITHTDKAHIHNHIMVNTVHSETGKTIHNKKELLFQRIRPMNDQIAQENGLSIVKPTAHSLDAHLPQAARKMVANGKKSFLYDIMQKADFARAASTSFDDYVSILKVMGVDARVENKNISYFYGDKEKGVRGKKIGQKFTNDGLIEAFKENDGKFAKHPELRARLRGEIGALHDKEGNRLGTPSDLLLESAVHTRFREKDYSQFTKVARDRTRSELPSPVRYNGILPLEEIKKARSQSIFDYCERNGIQTTVDKSGRKVLKGREFVVLEDTSWKNTKNHTNGSLIELVALHHNESFLQSIARINRSPRLLQLESVTGEVKRTFTSFYLPKTAQHDRNGSMEHIKRFSKNSGISETALNDLFELKKLQVGRNGSIWVFAGEKGNHAIEFQPQGASYEKKSHGDSAQAFESRKGTSQRVVVFQNPFDFIAHKQSGGKSQAKDSLLVSLDLHSDKSLDLFLARNPHVTQVDIVASPKSGRENERSGVERIKKQLDPFSIQVRGIDPIHAGRSRSHGPGIGR